MVFAVWAQRPGTPPVAEAFVESCRYGRARLPEIARLEASSRGFTEQQALDYLNHNIVNELGDLEYQGMDLFLRYSGVK